MKFEKFTLIFLQDNIQSLVLLADLGLVAVACALCSLLFPSHKFGTNQKILIGKMNYFLK